MIKVLVRIMCSDGSLVSLLLGNIACGIETAKISNQSSMSVYY